MLVCFACPTFVHSGVDLQECAVTISPITDEACADRYSNDYDYNSLTVQAFYQSTRTVRSLLPVQGSSFMLNLDPSDKEPADIYKNSMLLFAATANASLASIPTEQCTSNATVTGGHSLFQSGVRNCPAGSYVDIALATGGCKPW